MEFDYVRRCIMTTRSIVKALVEEYLSKRGVLYTTVKDVARALEGSVEGVDMYRMVYGIGLHDVGFTIERDEDDVYIRMV
jgi:hypothetical protein